MPKLENWRVIGESNDSYGAPEHLKPRLAGNVYGHSRFEDGEEIKTSPITAVNGKVIHTKTGTSYELGKPDVKYADWCLEHGYPIDADSPIKVKTPLYLN